MPFWNIHYSINSLRKEKIYRRLFCSLSSLYSHSIKRAVLSASMTVEAAFVLPMFIFFSVVLIYIINLINFQNSVNEKMYDTVRTLSKMEYAVENSANIATASLMLNGEIGQDVAKQMGILGGVAGIVPLGSEFDGEMVDFVVRYTAQTPFNMLDVMDLYCTQRMSVRKWIGNSDEGDGNNGVSGSDDVLVYITETGTVYHTNRNCTHIRLSIREVSQSQVEDLKNTGGGKYYACEICDVSGGYGSYYITDTGDRYHKNRNCSGLKRSILTVPLSAVGDKPLCSRCGG